MPRTKKAASPARPSTPPTAQLALGKVQSELDALPSESLIQVNIDIPMGVSVVLGALPGILAHRGDLEKLHGFDIRVVDRLETYALAVWYAHLRALPPPNQNQVRALIDEAGELRASLLADADVLVKRGIFDANTVAAVRAGHGHVDLANDLVALSAMYQQAWDAIGGRSFITEVEVERAGRLGPELLSALGVRAHVGPTGADEAADPVEQKMRAFALFAAAYDEVRRGLVYLRWHEDDADLIAPSLYRRGARSAGRGESRTDAVVAPEVAPEKGVVAPPA